MSSSEDMPYTAHTGHGTDWQRIEDRQDGGQARIECGNKMTQPTSEANTKLTGKRTRNGHFMKCLMDVNYVWQLPIDVYVLCLSVCMYVWVCVALSIEHLANQTSVTRVPRGKAACRHWELNWFFLIIAEDPVSLSKFYYKYIHIYIHRKAYFVIAQAASSLR